MPKSIEEYQNMKYTDIDRYKAIQLDVKNVNLQNEIIKTYNLSLREGQQGKHILGHNNYLKGRSYISNATMEEIRAAADAAQADGFVNAFTDGYNMELGQGGVNVSGGQKQRLCIARAL